MGVAWGSRGHADVALCCCGMAPAVAAALSVQLLRG